jgi:hypothetical protein
MGRLQSQALGCQLQFAIEEYYYFFCGLMQFVLLFFRALAKLSCQSW